MQDIGQLILGGTKPPPQQGGDLFRFENLQPSQVEMAVKRFTEMGQNPRLLETILTNPERFNSYPLEIRQRFFEMSTGSQPIMAKSFNEPSTQASAAQPTTQPTMRQTSAW